MAAFVSLLRGINVGGHRVVRMNDLKDMYVSLGFRDVVSYIQSGNVVFSSDEVDATHIQKRIEESFEKSFGFHADVLVRTSNELRAIIKKNPFQNSQGKESKWITVMLLARCPDATAQEDLLKTYVGPEELFILGQEVYIYYPDGIGRSKLSHSLLEKKLKTVGTARNWNTLLKLQELLPS